MGLATRLGLLPDQLAEVETVLSQASAYGADAFRTFDELLSGHILRFEPIDLGGPRTDAAISASCDGAATQLARNTAGLLWPRRAASGSPAFGAATIGQKHALLSAGYLAGSPVLGSPVVA